MPLNKTKEFNLETTSVKAFDDIIKEREKELIAETLRSNTFGA